MPRSEAVISPTGGWLCNAATQPHKTALTKMLPHHNGKGLMGWHQCDAYLGGLTYALRYQQQASTALQIY